MKNIVKKKFSFDKPITFLLKLINNSIRRESYECNKRNNFRYDSWLYDIKSSGATSKGDYLMERIFTQKNFQTAFFIALGSVIYLGFINPLIPPQLAVPSLARNNNNNS